MCCMLGFPSRSCLVNPRSKCNFLLTITWKTKFSKYNPFMLLLPASLRVSERNAISKAKDKAVFYFPRCINAHVFPFLEGGSLWHVAGSQCQSFWALHLCCQVERRCCQFQKLLLTAVRQAQFLLAGAVWPKAFVLFSCIAIMAFPRTATAVGGEQLTHSPCKYLVGSSDVFFRLFVKRWRWNTEFLVLLWVAYLINQTNLADWRTAVLLLQFTMGGELQVQAKSTPCEVGAGPGGGQLRSVAELPIDSTEDWVRAPFAGRAQKSPSVWSLQQAVFKVFFKTCFTLNIRASKMMVRQFQEQLYFISITTSYVKLKSSFQGLQHC